MTSRRWQTGVVTLLWLAVLLGGQIPTSSAKGAVVYIAAGDSIAAGIGASLPRTRGYPAQVRNLLELSGDHTVLLENVAVPGETASTFLTNGQLDAAIAAIETAATTGLPVVAISVTLGGNEMLRLRSVSILDREQGLEEFAADYRQALASLRLAAGPNVPIIATTYYDPTGGDASVAQTDAWWLLQFNDVIRQAAGESGALVADIEPVFAGRINEYTYAPFDVHPTNAGHVAISRTVVQSLQPTVEEPEIELVSTPTFTRQTPTLRFRVRSEVGVASVSAASDEMRVYGPFDDESGEYLALLDFDAQDDGDSRAVVIISVTDALGRQSTHDVTVSLDSGTGSEP